MGFAGVWHPYNPPSWTGDTGFYQSDFRPPPQSDTGSITWSPIHLWAARGFWLDQMAVTFAFDDYYELPTDRDFYLELLYVPEDMTGAPEVGTRWEIPQTGQLTVHVPTYEAKEGHGGYQFAVTMTEVVPEPASLFYLLSAGCFCVLRKRNRKT